ncbi:MAG: adenylosuccinate lyase [Acidobacteriota bacterium]
MIERYTREVMGRLFTDQARLENWLKVELAATEVLAERGIVPESALATIRKKAVVDVARALEIEKTTNHDVIAFVTSVAEKIGPEGRHLHWGLTSSDVVDTALALQLIQALDLLIEDSEQLLAALRMQAESYAMQPMVGRTHGVHAEPITFGLKIASWYAEIARGRERLSRARETAAYGKLSGAVGTNSQLDPDIEKATLDKLGLKVEPVSTQVVPRDRHAEVLCALALLAAGLERIATEIRHMQRTEVREVEEPFAKGQKGSSAMPHKRNPISCENVSGLARVVRSNALAALQDVALWHERDISHSSVERVIVPDSFILLDFMLARMTRVITGLHVYPDAMAANLERSRGFVFSQTVLLKLVEAGLTREDAYSLVQENAMKVWANEFADLDTACLADPRIVTLLGEKGVNEAFDLKRLLQHVPRIIKRALKTGPKP